MTVYERHDNSEDLTFFGVNGVQHTQTSARDSARLASNQKQRSLLLRRHGETGLEDEHDINLSTFLGEILSLIERNGGQQPLPADIIGDIIRSALSLLGVGVQEELKD
ncbi:hypothetical protein KJE20_13922 [Pyrenophora tritici-repentis]|nr:hypothetical protein KJE20_13922 [Pyrenophora tritici-repentis]